MKPTPFTDMVEEEPVHDEAWFLKDIAKFNRRAAFLKVLGKSLIFAGLAGMVLLVVRLLV